MPWEIGGNPFYVYLILGVLTGILGATLGVGGGILMVPALVILAAIPQKEAQGISLTVMIPLAIMSAIRYNLNPDIHVNGWIVLLLSATVIIGANIGASLAFYLSNRVLSICFAILMFIVGFRMIWSAIHPANG